MIHSGATMRGGSSLPSMMTTHGNAPEFSAPEVS